MRVFQNMTELIGNTPLVRLSRIEHQYGVQAVLLAKVEGMNPGGSAKDRPALKMIEEAELEGRLLPGGTIIEPTSGNTGIGLAAVAACRGYHVVLTMPDNMSIERRRLASAYGAEIVLTPAEKGMTGAVEKAEELQKSIPNSILGGQFDNPANPSAHEATTGPEIWRDTDGTVDIFVAGVGTGGTITGTARYLKAKNAAVQIMAVEPSDSPLLSQGRSGAHGLQGIGANFVPDNLDESLLDAIVPVTDADAYVTSRALARQEGILAGISSGAALWAAVELSRYPEYQGKTIVVLLPDTGERYLSTPLYATE